MSISVLHAGWTRCVEHQSGRILFRQVLLHYRVLSHQVVAHHGMTQ